LTTPFKGRDVISILDFTRDELEVLFDAADKMDKFMHRGYVPKLLTDQVVSLAFFEPSTRTRLSFELAAKRLGAVTIGFAAEESTSVAKGESFADTIRMLDAYSDIIIVRHRYEGAALFASEIAESPVINAGDGRQHHPTQAMVDLYTVLRLFGTIDGLTYGVLGDLRYSRAASSFILGLTRFKPSKVYLIAPPLLKPRPEVKMVLDRMGTPYEEVDSLRDVIHELDVLYVVRIQKERFPDPEEYERVKGSYKVTLKLVEERGKDSLKILHPLPKVDEVDPALDNSKYAAYYEEARLAIPLRMALLALISGVEV